MLPSDAVCYYGFLCGSRDRYVFLTEEDGEDTITEKQKRSVWHDLF
jgi:hypothetical protein